MPYIAGFQAKLLINGARYAFTKATYHMRVTRLPTTNSEGLGGVAVGAPRAVAIGPGAETAINGNGVCELTITQASFDPLLSPFRAPYVILPGIFISVQIFPCPTFAPIGNPLIGDSLFIPSFQVVDVSGDADSTGLEPISFQGYSNGNFSLPFA